MNLQKRSVQPLSSARPTQRSIRFWREAKRPAINQSYLLDGKSLPDGKSLQRLLRQERARSEGGGYDLNRHIRLIQWRRAVRTS